MDLISREDLADLHVTAFTSERGWRGPSQSPVFKRFTEGEWTLRIRHDGYDTLEVAGIRLRRGVTTDLGDLILPRGTGQIFGEVGPYGEGDVSLTLRGRAGFPCSIHGLTKDVECDTCTHPQDSDARTIPGNGGIFEFTALTEGEYWLEANGTKGETLYLERLVVASGEALRRDIRWERQTLRLRVSGPTRGTSAGAFTGAWTEGAALFMAPVTFHFFIEDRACAAASATPSGLAEYERSQREAREREGRVDGEENRATKLAMVQRRPQTEPELFEINEWGQASVLVRVADRWDTWVESDFIDPDLYEEFESSESRQEQGGHPLDQAPDDSAVTDQHLSWPVRKASTPMPTAKRVAAAHRGGGLYEVENVPVATDFVFIRSGPYHGTAELDPGVPASTIWRVDLSARCLVPSKEAVRGQKCVDCHSGMPKFGLVW